MCTLPSIYMLPRWGVFGVYGVNNSKLWGNCEKDVPIITKIGTRMWIHLGMDICYKQISSSIVQEAF